ncbi:MAG: PAS domain-containing protein [Methanocella sp.]
MGQRITEGKKDADKDRAELIAELNYLRDFNSRLKNVVKRYEKVAGKKDSYRSQFDLEADKERVESLQIELQKKQAEIDFQGEELGVQNEELRAQLEEIDTLNDVARMNAALRESSERLRVAQQVAHIGTFEWNIQTGVNTWTPELEAMYGLPAGGFPGTFEAWAQLVYPADRPEAVQRINEALEKGGFEGEWRVVWPDGTVHWLHGRGFIFKDESGKPLKLIGINIDITEHKQAEEVLRESVACRRVADAVEAERRRLFDVLETLPAMICLLTPDYHVAFANRSFRERFGESHGRYCYDYCFGRTEPCEFCETYNVLKTGQPHHWEVTGPDGSVIEAYDFPFTDADGSPMILEMDIDITERKRVEDAMRTSQESLANAQQIAHLGNWSWDIRTNRQEWSNESYCIFGFEPGEVQPDYDLYMGLLHPEDKGKLLACMKDILEGNIPFDIDYRIIRRDGSVRYVHSEGKITRDAEGKPLRMFGINQDITERKLAEKELSEAKAQAELYLDLMGHDINNMHQIALGYLELAKEMPAGEGLARSLDKSIEVLHRSARLIRDVKKLKNLRSGSFQTKDVDVCKVLSEMPREFGAVPYKRVSLNMNGCEQCHVVANELLHDVFANLVVNAIKHTGARADIFINLDRVEENGKSYCRVSVEDNGPGIPDDHKGTIFNRAMMSTSKAKGMGLGLYLVKSLVDSYGGRVRVEDRIAGDHTRGARFVVTLPAVEK